uniref:Uncharacterized protein n=1 Tax=Arundo donax TaxID=35708 RepID=A0A0A9C1I0_ARUDO
MTHGWPAAAGSIGPATARSWQETRGEGKGGSSRPK